MIENSTPGGWLQRHEDQQEEAAERWRQQQEQKTKEVGAEKTSTQTEPQEPDFNFIKKVIMGEAVLPEVDLEEINKQMAEEATLKKMKVDNSLE